MGNARCTPDLQPRFRSRLTAFCASCCTILPGKNAQGISPDTPALFVRQSRTTSYAYCSLSLDSARDSASTPLGTASLDRETWASLPPQKPYRDTAASSLSSWFSPVRRFQAENCLLADRRSPPDHFLRLDPSETRVFQSLCP